MNNKEFALCISFLILILVFSGCFEDKKNDEANSVDKSQFIGTWEWKSDLSGEIPPMIHVVRFSFFENDTASYNVSDVYMETNEIGEIYSLLNIMRGF